MYEDNQIQKELLKNRDFFSEEDEIIAASMMDNRIEEYSALNPSAKEYHFKVYRIKNNTHRLFFLKTAQGNLFPVLLLIPKSREHDPKEYWKTLESKARALSEWIAQKGEPLTPPREKKKAVAASALAPAKAVETPKLDMAVATPLKKVKYWCEKVNKASCYEEQEMAILALAEQVHQCGIVSYDGAIYYQAKASGVKHNISIEIREKDRIMDKMHLDIQSGNQNLLKLFSVLVVSSKALKSRYIVLYCNDYIKYFEPYLTGSLLVTCLEAVDKNWEQLNTKTQEAVILQAKHSNELYRVLMSKSRYQNVFKNKKIITLLLNEPSCPWKFYMKWVDGFSDATLLLHIPYLMANIEKLRNAEVLETLGPIFLTVREFLPEALKKAFNFNLAMVHISGQARKRDYASERYRRENHRNFLISDWIHCFEYNLGVDEFMGYVNQYPYPPEGDSYGKDFWDAMSRHAPVGYEVRTPQKYMEIGLFGNILVQSFMKMDVTKEVFLRSVQVLFSYLHHRGILINKIIQSDISKFLLISTSMDIFESVLSILPDREHLTAGRVSLLKHLINSSERLNLLGLGAQRDMAATLKNLYLEPALQKSLEYFAPNNPNEQMQLLQVHMPRGYETPLMDFRQSYLQAIEARRYDIAETLLKKLPYEEIQSAAVYLHQIKVCTLNPRELIEFLPLTYIMKIAAGNTEKAKTLTLEQLNKRLSNDFVYKDDQIIWILKPGVAKSVKEVSDVLSQIEEDLDTEMTAIMRTLDLKNIDPDREETIEAELAKAPHLRDINSAKRSIAAVKEHFCKLDRDYKQKIKPLIVYLDKIGMKVSERKINFLRSLLADYEDPILKMMTSPEYEFECIEAVSGILAENDNFVVKVPKVYIERTGFSSSKKEKLSKIEVFSILELAVLFGAKNVMDMLVYEYGVPFGIRESGLTALHIAIWKGDLDMALVLLEHDKALVSFHEETSVVSKWVHENIDRIDIKSMIDRCKTLPKSVKENGDFREMFRDLLAKQVSVLKAW